MTSNPLVAVKFHGQTLVTTQHNGEPHVAMRPIVEAMGLDWQAQLQRIKRHPVLAQGVVMITTPSDGGTQETNCLPLKLLNGWLFGIDTNRVKPEIRETILMYQRECYDALYRYWHEGQATNPRFRPEKTRKALPCGLTVEQQDAVKALIKSRVEAFPRDRQAKAAITCWSAIKSKFGVSYKAVPAECFGDVLSLVARLELDKCAPKALPLDIHYPLESAAPPIGEKGLTQHTFSEKSEWIDPGWELLMKLRDAGFNVDGPIYSHRAKLHVMKVMYDALMGKMIADFNALCASLPYAPVYLR